jgi:hypothetical protein
VHAARQGTYIHEYSNLNTKTCLGLQAAFKQHTAKGLVGQARTNRQTGQHPCWIRAQSGFYPSRAARRTTMRYGLFPTGFQLVRSHHQLEDDVAREIPDSDDKQSVNTALVVARCTAPWRYRVSCLRPGSGIAFTGPRPGADTYAEPLAHFRIMGKDSTTRRTI